MGSTGGLALQAILESLAASLQHAQEAIDSSFDQSVPADGISLLDTKNELLLSYVQHLVFLMLLRLRNARGSSPRTGPEVLDEKVVSKLVEHRMYLEKGTKPLEGRLKYQIEKVLRAATNEDEHLRSSRKQPKSSSRGMHQGLSEENESDGDKSATEEEEQSKSGLDDLLYRPNPASFVRPSKDQTRSAPQSDHDGVYRPPRITPTALPTTDATLREGKGGRRERPQKSATMDEFVNAELSTTPLAEPSIGSAIVDGGRRSVSQRERADASRRRMYEEENFIRLPKESKKERAKKGKKEDAGYGGEDWKLLGTGLDRINKLTSKSHSSRSGNLLEQSRKRGNDTATGKGGPDLDIGGRFEKRRKVLGRRKR